MSNLIYASIEGNQQGLISAGCSTQDSIGNRAQIGHEDQIYVYAFDHDMYKDPHVNHHPIIINKPIDKSSPLLAMSLSNNEKLQVKLYMYRLNMASKLEIFYTIKLHEAQISQISQHSPHALSHNGVQPYETLSIAYKSIDWQHVSGTQGYYIWDGYSD